MTPPTHCKSVQRKFVADTFDNHCHCEGEARGNLLVKRTNSNVLPGDCRVGLRPPRNDSSSRRLVLLIDSRRLSSLVGGVMTPPYRDYSSSAASFFSSEGITKGLQTTSQRLMGVPRAWNFSS